MTAICSCAPSPRGNKLFELSSTRSPRNLQDLFSLLTKGHHPHRTGPQKCFLIYGIRGRSTANDRLCPAHTKGQIAREIEKRVPSHFADLVWVWNTEIRRL
ncbi:hypothetical protein CDAR_381611 [Caerostris darwini]|uniref:Uncharacterized protein n=1 Tax=Caerostris darwini TaxID=1538125 RepID=A0AAV4V5J0_9ARAC|nr:hypothetical protein CDAR_381611 [Caerostris darwini]